jgi:hypothetical protein
MTPERMARVVRRWVRFYTHKLPPSVAERRISEIDADLHDHVAHDRARGIADRRIALSIAARLVRGAAADASWRKATLARSSSRKEVMKGNPPYRSVVRVALATAVVLVIPLVAMAFSDGVAWSLADFVFAGALVAVTGLLLELAARRPRAFGYRAAAVAIGIAAIALGQVDDAPGLILFGGLLITGTVALTIRTAQRRG